MGWFTSPTPMRLAHPGIGSVVGAASISSNNGSVGGSAPARALGLSVLRRAVEGGGGVGGAPHSSHPSFGHLILLVFEAVMEVVCVSLPGYIVARQGMFNAEQQKFTANLNVALFTPCLIFTKLASQLSADKLADLAVIPIIFMMQTLVSYVSSICVSKAFGFKKRPANFVTAMGVFGNSNSLPISLVISLSQTLNGLHWAKIPGDNDDEVAARGILYLLIFQQLGQLVRWSWGYHVLLAPPDAYKDNEEAAAIEEGRYRDDLGTDQLITGLESEEDDTANDTVRRRSSDYADRDTSSSFESGGRTPVDSAQFDGVTRFNTDANANANAAVDVVNNSTNINTANINTTTSNATATAPNHRTSSLINGHHLRNGLTRQDSIKTPFPNTPGMVPESPHTRISSFPFPAVPPRRTSAASRLAALPRGPRGWLPRAQHHARRLVAQLSAGATAACASVGGAISAVLPAPLQRALAAAGRAAGGFAAGAWEFMNPPLWAMLLAVIVASVPALQRLFFADGSFVANSVTRAVAQSGGVAVPLILVVLGANLARSTLPREEQLSGGVPADEEQEAEEREIGTRLMVAALVSRMVLPTLVMAPVLALMAKYLPVSILDDPIFVVVCFLLTGAPSALQLAQICQINGVYEGVMSKLLFQSYVIWILPSTLILVMCAMEVVEWANGLPQ